MERQCGECGTRGMVPFEGASETVEHAGFAETVEGLSGWRCARCGEVDFTPESAERYSEAGDRLVRLARAADAAEVRRIREKLGLGQAELEALTGGGHNGPSRWETGKAPVSRAVMNLLRLLDRDPARLKELQG